MSLNRIARTRGAAVSTGLLVCALAITTIHGLVSNAADTPETVAESKEVSESTQAKFMRQKLATAQKVIEGLATEDFELIRDAADEWLSLAESSGWEVPRDPFYMQYSRNFEDTVGRLRDAAEKRNIHEATFAYTHVTISCMMCHEHVRGAVRVAPHARENSATTRRVQ